MKSLFARLAICALSIAPLGAFAHPGHLDDVPLAHMLAHGTLYLLALTALGLLTKQHGKTVWRSIYDRIRSPR